MADMGEAAVNTPAYKELASKVAEMRKRIEDINIESNQRMGDANKNMWDGFVSNMASALGMTEAQFGEFANAMGGIVNGIMDLMKTASANKIEGYNQEIEAIDKRKEEELKAIDASAASEDLKAREKARIEARAEASRQSIEEKKKQEAMKQARWEKAWGIAQILINTATGIMKAAPVIPLMIAIGAMGAIQAAVVAAQPIPKYERGTEDHPGGAAIVGEKRPEAIILPGGRVIKSPEKATLFDLPKHTVVKPDYSAFVEDQTRKTLLMAKEVDLQNRAEYRELIESNRRMEKYLYDISKKKDASVSVNMDSHGFYHSFDAERNRTDYMNRQLHRVFH